MMKTKHFKVTKLAKLEGGQRQGKQPFQAFESPSRENKTNGIEYQRMPQFISPTFMDLFEQLSRKFKRQQPRYEVQARDRIVLVDLPEGQNNELQDDVLQEWITDVCNKVFSSAFNTLSTDKMSYEYTKIFCSEGILRNIVLLTKKFQLTQQQMKVINKHFQNKIVPYMKKKYPMTQSTDVNKTIDQSVRPIDNRQTLENDLLQKSGVVFTYRDERNRNYNDLIMKFLNWMMSSIDANTVKENKKSKTVYEEYYLFISKLFQNVYDSKWMDTKAVAPGKLNQAVLPSTISQRILEQKVISEAEKQKYKAQVKQYTHYAIGRKISKNVQMYTEEQIQIRHLKIKSPSILRILTKWCQQLWEKFSTKNYFLDRQQNVRVQEIDGNINTMFMWMKMPLNDLIQQEKQRIQKFMKDIEQNNFDQQSKLLLKELRKDGFTHVEKIEKACGKFACKTVNNLHSYIILYLNRIIHGLLWVSKELYDTKLSTKARWTLPPDLITFKVGDLMRCKLHSKEREILKIYKQLQYLSENQPEQMKLIRVKNRLKLSSNDILINVIYKKTYLCEIQLAVNAVQSKFIQTSNLFNHYIYELGRTLFGPVTQLCSVWMSLDPRSSQYFSIINNQKRQIKQQPILCPQNVQHIIRTQDRPFVCSKCNIAYSHTNYIRKHKKCINNNCSYRICARCRIQSEDEHVLKDKFLSGQSKQVREACCAIVNRKAISQQTIPNYGVCMQIESKEIKVQRFKKLEIKRIMTIYGIRQKDGKEKIVKIEDLIKKDAQQKFLKKYIIFEIEDDKGEKLVDITIDKAKKDFIIPQKVKEIYKKEKQILSLIEQNLDDESCKIMMGQKIGMQSVLNMELADNKFTKIQFITSNFKNLNRLQLSRNLINNIDTISKLKDMQKLNLRDNKLQALPEELCTLTKLQGLNIRNNQIKELPQNFGDLTLLNKLESDNNQFKDLPESFCKLVNLEFIDLSKNKLTKFPEQFKNFVKLEELLLSGNVLGDIPDWIDNFKVLTTLDLSKTKLKVVPKTIYNLTALKILKFQALEANLIEPAIKNLVQLKELGIKIPNLVELTGQIFELNKLQSISLEECKIKKLPSRLSQLVNLTSLSLINNNLESFEDVLRVMVNLKNLKLQGQHLSVLPEGLKQLVNLRTLSLGSNNFKEIPMLVTNYKRLYSLSMAKNQLQNISEQIADGLPEIQTINLDNNKFTRIPPVVRKWRKLKKATLLNNPGISQADLKELKKIIKQVQKNLLTNHMSMTKTQSMANSYKFASK